jgi:hypothetical protein
MKITIETIPHSEQRYPTVGDWLWEPNGDLTIRVSELGDWRYNALVGLHELVEVLKCKYDGVKPEDVVAFDIAYEKKRAKGNDCEPGDDPRAPYYLQHGLATGIERIMATELRVCWCEYEHTIYSLP